MLTEWYTMIPWYYQTQRLPHLIGKHEPDLCFKISGLAYAWFLPTVMHSNPPLQFGTS